MAFVKYKYNINQQISLLPRHILIRDIERLLEKEGISRDTFYRDRNLNPKSETSIPTDRLQKYANLFECSLDDLITTQVKKGKSIREQLLKEPREKKPKKINSGLS